MIFFFFHVYFYYKLGVISHAIGHTLGLWHEAYHRDWSKYVELEGHSNYQLFYSEFGQQTYSYGVPYDIYSLMHYDSDKVRVSHNLRLQ